eukprot:10624498-Prorocentrum_lima.AAC.1
MTSSLVGSEMCIRDRNKAGGTSAARSSSNACFTSKLCLTSALPKHNKKAVSYTHLTLPTICSV